MKTFNMYLIVVGVYLGMLFFAANHLGINLAEMFNNLSKLQ